MRPFIVAGNWKMNHTIEQAHAFVEDFKDFFSGPLLCEVVVFPSALCWQEIKTGAEDLDFKWGLQHVHAKESGAFTGEISVSMAKDVGADYVLIGHSERRQLFSETDSDVAEKVIAAQNLDLIPMICLGETLEEREAGKTNDVVLSQLRAALELADKSKDFVIAYEPVWAIGTGKVATPEQAQEVHVAIREELKNMNSDLAERTSILYGGSVKPDNAADLGQQSEIDGFLVGGASLSADSFLEIIRNSDV